MFHLCLSAEFYFFKPNIIESLEKDNFLDITSQPPEPKTEVNITIKDKKSFVIVAICVILWATDPLHKIDPVYVGLGTVLLLFFPTLGVLPFSAAREINFLVLLFMNCVTSIGTIISNTPELNELIGHSVISWITKVDNTYLRYYVLVLVSVPFMFFDNVAASGVLISIFMKFQAELALNPVLMAYCVAMASIVLFLPYQSGPLLISYNFGYTTFLQFALALFINSILTLGILVPLNLAYWKLFH